MLAEQREWQERAANGTQDVIDPLQGIHLFADGSPVTGTEIQGMVMESFYRCKEVTSDILPAISLSHGDYSWIAKAFCLIWALYLIAGDYPTLRYICSRVKSLTTDCGTELHLLDTPDLLPAFFLWLQGAPHWQLIGSVFLVFESNSGIIYQMYGLLIIRTQLS